MFLFFSQARSLSLSPTYTPPVKKKSQVNNVTVVHCVLNTQSLAKAKRFFDMKINTFFKKLLRIWIKGYNLFLFKVLSNQYMNVHTYTAEIHSC